MSQIKRVLMITSLSAHSNRGFHFKLSRAAFDELVEFVDIAQLRHAIQQQRCVIGVGHAAIVQRFKVRRQVVNALRIEKLSNHVTRLETTDGAEILLHGGVVVGFVVQMITVFAVNVDNHGAIELLRARQIDGACVQILFEQRVEFRLRVFLFELQYVAVGQQHKQRAPFGHHVLHGRQSRRRVRDEFVFQIIHFIRIQIPQL